MHQKVFSFKVPNPEGGLKAGPLDPKPKNARKCRGVFLGLPDEVQIFNVTSLVGSLDFFKSFFGGWGGTGGFLVSCFLLGCVYIVDGFPMFFSYCSLMCFRNLHFVGVFLIFLLLFFLLISLIVFWLFGVFVASLVFCRFLCDRGPLVLLTVIVVYGSMTMSWFF